MSVFYRFAPRLREAIVSRLGWSSLRPVQEEAGEALLAGKNAVILAPTAGGKTEASIFPILSDMLENPPQGVGVLYVAPLKALLNNQADRLGQYTEMVGLRSFVWHGDISGSSRRTFLKDPAEILMTTPESLEVMFVTRRVDTLFSELRMLIVDEVHAVAGSDRGAHLMSIVERVACLSRFDVQRVGLSATVGNPKTILDWIRGTSRRESVVIDPPNPPSRKQLLVVYETEPPRLAQKAASMAKGFKTLFFCPTRSTTEEVAAQMRKAGTEVFVHHSAVSKEERASAEELFHRGSDACIVCTSTLELGIDVGDLDRVLQAEPPATVSSFLQRMGRTGRRPDQVLNTTFFCSAPQTVLQAVALVELAKKKWVERVEIDERCWPVMIHQLLAMSLASDALTTDGAWRHLSQVPDFRGIRRAEYEHLVRWMIRDGSLVVCSGRLTLGPRAERLFGRRNFMDLFSVFTSPESYTVRTSDGSSIGTLSQEFVDRLADDVSSFLLAGRAWVVSEVQHKGRRVVVAPARHGELPTWMGSTPQFLSFEVCQEMLAVLRSDASYRCCNAEAAAVLEEYRDAMALHVERGSSVESEPGEVRWWTFAGGRLNSTLKYALQAAGVKGKVSSDNLMLRIHGEGVDRSSFVRAVERLEEKSFWQDEDVWSPVASSFPNYRLSKFQPLMPPWIEREVIGSHLLDVRGAWEWLTGEDAGDSLKRVPDSVRRLNLGDNRTSVAVEHAPEPQAPRLRADMARVVWVDAREALDDMCLDLRSQEVVGLDVETDRWTRALCLVQIATPRTTYLVDVLEVVDLDALGPILADERVVKVIHHAPFERGVLRNYGFEIEGVVDTCAVSREVRGGTEKGRHTLQAVCLRELGGFLDKSQQTSDWTRRPLTKAQVEYAALDAEILLRLHRHFRRGAP